jgi:hypothetical protein
MKFLIKYYFALAFLIQNCSSMNHIRNAIAYVEDDEFIKIVEGKDYKFLSEYIGKYGMLVHKKVDEDIYMVYYNSMTFRITGKNSLKLFRLHPDKVIKQLGITPPDMAPREALYKKNPYNKDFPEHTDELIKELLNKLQINNTTDLNESLFELIDQRLGKMGKPKKFLDQNFLNIIALFGEALKRRYPDYKWEMELSDLDGETWSPSLKSSYFEISLLHYISKAVLYYGDRPLAYVFSLLDYFAQRPPEFYK